MHPGSRQDLVQYRFNFKHISKTFFTKTYSWIYGRCRQNRSLSSPTCLIWQTKWLQPLWYVSNPPHVLAQKDLKWIIQWLDFCAGDILAGFTEIRENIWVGSEYSRTCEKIKEDCRLPEICFHCAALQSSPISGLSLHRHQIVIRWTAYRDQLKIKAFKHCIIKRM